MIKSIVVVLPLLLSSSTFAIMARFGRVLQYIWCNSPWGRMEGTGGTKYRGIADIGSCKAYSGYRKASCARSEKPVLSLSYDHAYIHTCHTYSILFKR
jgi:hypothetical protein